MYGAGIYATEFDSLVVRLCRFVHNGDTTRFLLGGGLYAVPSLSAVPAAVITLEDNEFLDNQAVVGGGVCAVAVFSDLFLEARRNAFQNNVSLWGGSGMMVAPEPGTRGVVRENDFEGNLQTLPQGSNRLGGAGLLIFSTGGKVDLRNNLFHYNHAEGYGGAVLMNLGMSFSGYTLHMVNNTFSMNSVGGANDGVLTLFYRASDSLGTLDTAWVLNNIFHNNPADYQVIAYNLWQENLPLGYLDYCLFFPSNASGSVINMVTGENLYSQDPQLDVHLYPLSSSPVIDSGTNCAWSSWEEVDLAGTSRFVDGQRNPGEPHAIRVDLGAYEYATAFSSTLHCGDVNQDGVVDRNDPKYLYHFLEGDTAYRVCPVEVADVNEDGTVDMADYVYLDTYTQQGYPEPCNPPFGSGDKQALLATGDPEVQGQYLSLPVYGYLEAKSGGYLLEFQVPEGFTFTGAELSPEAPTGLVLYTRVEGPEVRLVVADTLPEDGLTYLEAGTQELVRLHLTYEGHPVGFVLTGKDLQFADTAGTRMLAGFVTGGSQAYVTLRDLATRITVVGSRVVQQDLRVRYSLSRTLEPAEVALYDAAGRRVRVLYRGTLAAGHREVVYPVGSVSDGVYFLRVEAPGFRHVEKVVVLR